MLLIHRLFVGQQTRDSKLARGSTVGLGMGQLQSLYILHIAAASNFSSSEEATHPYYKKLLHIIFLYVILSNLSKAVGLNTMIDVMLPDFDNIDEHVRNTNASAFSVVASTLGIPALLPFLKAVCQSNKSWLARYTGIKIVEQIAILIGCEALPHLKSLVEIIEHGLNDENQEVRTITGLSLAALAKSSAPA